MKESCACKTLDFVRQTKGKSLIVPVDEKQKLIMCLWEKNIESIQGCEAISWFSTSWWS